MAAPRNRNDPDLLSGPARFPGVGQKQARELWVAERFLIGLGEDVDRGLLRVGDDPPDVLYGACRFEIKEIVDHGLTRQKACADSITRGGAGDDQGNRGEGAGPTVITWRDVYETVIARAAQTQDRYSPLFSVGVDLLFYYNRSGETLRDSEVLIASRLYDCSRWRSVSVMRSGWSRVIHRGTDAPAILRNPERAGARAGEVAGPPSQPGE